MFEPSGAPIAFPRVRESGTASPSLARLKPLLEIANFVRDERELEDVLESIAETISTGLGWRTVVVNLYRPAWDDFHVSTVFGNADARRALLGTTSTWEDWKPLLAERFLRCGAYVVRHGELDWRRLELPTFVPPGAAAQDPEGWDPEDSLLVPLAHAGRGLLGILSIDEPIAGRIPADADLDLVVAMAAQAAHAIEQLQRHKETRRHRAALEQLHEVSIRLSGVSSYTDVLDTVAHSGSRRSPCSSAKVKASNRSHPLVGKVTGPRPTSGSAPTISHRCWIRVSRPRGATCFPAKRRSLAHRTVLITSRS
jgi:hypothetical protein